MNTSPQTLWKSASSLEDIELSPAILGYFHGLSQDEAHEVVLRTFEDAVESDHITRAFIARRIGKSPEQVTRWLGASGNWTLDTYTNLLVAMGYRPTFGAERLSDMRQSNQHHPAAAALPPVRMSVSSGQGAPSITINVESPRLVSIQV